MLFRLRNGGHHNRGMQSAGNAYGEAAFEFEVVERFAEDLLPMLLKDAMRDRQRHWEKELGARMV